MSLTYQAVHQGQHYPNPFLPLFEETKVQSKNSFQEKTKKKKGLNVKIISSLVYYKYIIYFSLAVTMHL